MGKVQPQAISATGGPTNIALNRTRPSSPSRGIIQIESDRLSRDVATADISIATAVRLRSTSTASNFPVEQSSFAASVSYFLVQATLSLSGASGLLLRAITPYYFCLGNLHRQPLQEILLETREDDRT